MKRCAFLTMDDLSGYSTHDALVHAPLRALGWVVEDVSWRAAMDWSRFDLVVIRSPWDYQHDPIRFLSVLAAIEDAGARLENPLPVVRWNLDKRYLRELAAAGVAIVPSRWIDAGAPIDLPRLRRDLGAGELIVKPVVSANAEHTYRLPPEADDRFPREVFNRRACVVQPFLEEVLSEGEASVFHFGGVYSHAIVKTPRAGDFRVQEEHGGSLRRVDPGAALRAAAERALGAVPASLLYARSDFVRHRGEWLLMELELIEPSLYFELDPGAPARFARCIDRRMSGAGA